MDEFLAGNYNECIQKYEQLLLEESDKLTPEELGMAYCNISAAEFGLELFRKCAQSCDQSIAIDPKCLRAYLIQAAAYIAMKKYLNAKESCELGLQNVNDYSDTQLVKQLKEYLTVTNSLTMQMPTASKILTDHQSTNPTALIKSGKGSVVTMEQLTLLRDQFISEGDEPGKVQRSYLAGARRSLCHATGDDVVDDLIGFGYLLVNSGRLTESAELFDVLLQYTPDLYAGHLAIGSVRALQGKLNDAMESLTTAISICPREADAWKRRGQTKAALGNHMDAFEDYNHALTFSNDPELYFQRGVLYQQLRNFRRGISDYLKHNELTTSRTCQLWNNMGICQSHLGDIENATISFRNAMEEDESFVDAYLNYAQMFKEIGDWKEALVQYDTVYAKFSSQLHLPQVEKNLFQMFNLRSVLYYSLGRPLHSLGDAKRHLDFIFENSNSTVLKSPYKNKDMLQAYAQIAMCFRSLGCYQDALKYYNLILELEPENVCRVQKRIMLLYYSLLDSSPHSFNVDRDVDSRWKEIWSKGLAANGLDIPDSPLEREPLEDLFSPEQAEKMTLTPQQQKIFELARRFGPWVQIHSRGFLPNIKLHRGFGLAVLEMAQALKNNIDCIHRTGSPLMVPNSGSSQKYFAREGSHPFGYRDLFDIVVRWRQLSEPNDPVWWTDGLLRESFEEGFGLQTPMISGQLRTIRYYSYFKMGFEILRNQAANQYFFASSLAGYPSKNAKKKIKKATTLKELHGIIGQDFYVVCPCHSLANRELQTTVLEGTRLTVLKKEPEGYEFSIRCPSMPIRWKAMSDEITECYERMILALYHQRYPEDNPHLAPSAPDPLYHGLQLFYYWSNFSPLTRGSAFCGYGALFAVALAFGYQISSPIPEGRQLDWEAIFTSHPDDFIQSIKPQLTLEPFDVEEISTDGAMPTLRDMYKLLHHGMESE